MPDFLSEPKRFAALLHEKMIPIAPGIDELAPYEFLYCLHNVTPTDGWASVELAPPAEIEEQVNSRAFYNTINIKSVVNGRIVLDPRIIHLTQMLLVGLATGDYSTGWITRHFYFDVRGFYFLHRTTYFTPAVLDHFGGVPYRQFAQKQKALERCQSIGYPEFMAANAEVDQAFIETIKTLISARGAPTLLAIAGPTAAGKTEIVERLSSSFSEMGAHVTSIELDNFLTDRDYREEKGIHTQGKEALHFSLLVRALEDICAGKTISIPRYDFIYATSSHDLSGCLKPGANPIVIEPADIIFIEGNFPFLIQEVVHLIGIKVVYLTDDPIRMKRKWRRDIDYRKKYDTAYFGNRFFKDQFIMAEIAYRPQLELCDICVDTSGGALWVSPQVAAVLNKAAAQPAAR